MEYLRLGDLKIADTNIVQSFSEQIGYKYATHEMAVGKPMLQAIGSTLSTLSFTLQLNQILGHDVMGFIEQINKIRDSGKPQQLIFADGLYKGYFVVTEANTTVLLTSNNGRVISAELSLVLSEYSDREVISTVRYSESGSTKNKRNVITK